MKEALPCTTAESGPPIGVEITPAVQVPARYLENPASYGDTRPGEAATPAQAFAEHVQDVREHGDALDFIPAYSQKLAVGAKWWSAPAFLGVLMIATSSQVPTERWSQGMAYTLATGVLAGGACYGAHKNYKNQHKNLAEKAWGQDTQNRVDETYDLFRVQTGTDELTGGPTYEVHMRYYCYASYGRRRKDGRVYTTADHVKDAAALAESAGVDKLMISTVMAEALDVSTDDAVPMKKILEDAKPIKLRPDAFRNEDVVIRAPREWRTVEDRPFTGQKKDELGELVKALAKIDANHPVIRAYNDHKGRLTLAQALNSAVQATIRHEFSKSQKGSKRDQVRVNTKEGAAGEALIPRHMEASLRGYSVPAQQTAPRDAGAGQQAAPKSKEVQPARRIYRLEWSRDGTVSDVRPAEDVVSYGWSSKKDQELLLKNPTSSPNDAKQLILLLLAQQLDPAMSAEQKKALPSAAVVPKQEKKASGIRSDGVYPVLMRMLTDSVKVHKIQPDYEGAAWPSSRRKLLTAVGIVAAIGFGTYFGAEATNKAHEEQLAVAEQHVIAGYAKKHDIDPDKLDLGDPIVNQHIREYAEEYTLTPLSLGWEKLIGAQRTYSEWFDSVAAHNQWVDFLFGSSEDKPAASGPAPDVATTSSKANLVGDIHRTKPPEAEWNLEAKGMTTAGYWAATTSSKLVMLPNDGGLGWSSNETIAYSDNLPANYNGEQYIKVSRQLTPQDMPANSQVYHLARVPVLEGTAIVAATLNGKPVIRYGMQDGTTGLAAVDGISNHGALEYWLAPDPNARRPHAINPITVNAKQKGFDFTEVPYVWNKVISHFSEKTPAEQRRLMADYLNDKFYYALAPFEEKGEPPFESPGQYTEDVLKERRAQCNLAATILAIGTVAPSNPPELTAAEAVTAEPDDVNIVVGYHNDGDKALTDHEAHMWNVESDADRIDPVPVNHEPEAAETSQLPAESPTDESLRLIGWLLGSAVAGALLQRPARSAWYKVAAKRAVRAQSQAKTLLEDITNDPQALHQALDILDAVRHDPSRDLVRAANRKPAFADERNAKEAGLAKLMMVSHHDRTGLAEAQLKLSWTERRALDPQTRRAINNARRIMSNGRKLYKRVSHDMGYTIKPDLNY